VPSQQFAVLLKNGIPGSSIVVQRTQLTAAAGAA